VFEYDFSRERVFLEIAHAELEAMKAAEAEASTAAAASLAALALDTDAEDVEDVTDEEIARQVRSCWCQDHWISPGLMTWACLLNVSAQVALCLR
jgi:hypothetical protein